MFLFVSSSTRRPLLRLLPSHAAHVLKYQEAMFKDLKTWMIRYYGWVCEDVPRGIECAMAESVSRRNAAKHYEKCGYVVSPEVRAALQPLVQENNDTWLHR